VAQVADDQALQTLKDVEAIRVRTRQAVEWGWLPFVAFGVATLVSAPFTQVDDGYTIAVYWLVAAPMATAVTLVGYRRMEMRRGVVERYERVYVLLIAAMLAAALAIGFLADDGLASQVGPVFPVGIGLLAIAVIDSSPFIAATGALILALGVVLAVTAPANADTWAMATEGIVLIGAGLVTRYWT
jgi:hypothetical protein